MPWFQAYPVQHENPVWSAIACLTVMLSSQADKYSSESFRLKE
jgi:hypothetical protein